MKPENLLLDENNNIKVVDFGLGNLYQDGQLLQTACGSPCYAAPEMIAGKKYKGLETDIWSSGIILFAMICGFLPFEDKNTSKLYEKILKGEFSIPSYVSKEARDLIEKLLTIDPKLRININHIKSHSWFSSLKIKVVDNTEILRKFDILYGANLNEIIFDKMTNLNVKKEYIQKCLSENKHNHITASYYLYLKRFEEEKKNEIKQIITPHENLEITNVKKVISDDHPIHNNLYHEKINKFLSSVKNSEPKEINLKDGYSSNKKKERIIKNKENMPKSFDLSFDTNTNKGYFDENDNQTQVDNKKSFRIKSAIANKEKASIK